MSRKKFWFMSISRFLRLSMMTRILVFQEWCDISFPNGGEMNWDSLFVLGVKTEMDQGSTNRTNDRSPPVRMNSAKPTCVTREL